MVEKPFVKDANLASDFSENLEAVPDSEREKLDYVWIAFFNDREPLCQFDTDGSENSWSSVRENMGSLVTCFWMPVEGGTAFGVENTGSGVKFLRRVSVGFSEEHGQEKRFFYMLADGKDRKSAENFLFVSPDGKLKRSDDWDFNPETFFD